MASLGWPAALRRLVRGAVAVAACLMPGSAAVAQVPDTVALAGDGSQVAGARVTVHHEAGQRELAVAALRFLEAQPPLPALPPDVPSGVQAYLARNPETFAALAGGRVPEWSGGFAIPSLRRLVLPVFTARPFAGERGRVLRHEWAHLGLHQHMEPLRIPRWFDEGYAEWAGGWDRSEAWKLRLLLATGRAPPLDSLTLDWPRDAASAGAAYLLAATAVEYLVSESGERGLTLFLDRWKADGSFDAALRATYGVSEGQLEEHWRAWVRDRYGWVLVLSHSMLFWTVLGLLLVLMLGVRRRRNREKLARLRAGEEPDAPDYWARDGGAEPSGATGVEES